MGATIIRSALATRPSSIREGEPGQFGRVLPLGLILVLLLPSASCANASDEGGCALGLVRDGATYYPYEVTEPLPRGRFLGQVPSITCDDGNGEEGQPEFWEAVAIKGVDPSDAFLVPDESPSMIFAPGPPDGSKLSAEVERLLPDEAR